MAKIDGEKLDSATMSALIDSMMGAAQKTGGSIFSHGVSGIVTPFSMNSSLDQAAYDQNFIRQSFLGRVTNHGPNGEPDFDGSMYWVQEVWDSSFDPDPLHRPRFVSLDENPPFNLPPGRYGRWVPAVNLPDYILDEPGIEGRGIPVDGSVIVHVFMTLSGAGQSSYYFTYGGAGERSAFAVVRDVYGGNVPFIKIQIIEEDESGVWRGQTDENGQPQYADVRCWPPITSDHYEALVWHGDSITPDCNPIGIRQVGTRFYAEQTLLTFPVRSPGVAHSDCPMVY